MPRTVSVPILSTHAKSKTTRIFVSINFSFLIPRVFFYPTPFFRNASTSRQESSSASNTYRYVRLYMPSYKKKIPVRMNAQRNALEMEKKRQACEAHSLYHI